MGRKYEAVKGKAKDEGVCPNCGMEGQVGKDCVECTYIYPDPKALRAAADAKREEDDPDPDLQFEAVPGRGKGEKGVCFKCRGEGPIGKFCIDCCETQVGRCEDCKTMGPLGQECWECGAGDGKGPPYVEWHEMGECSNCGGVGIRYTLCTGCEDMCMVYE